MLNPVYFGILDGSGKESFYLRSIFDMDQVQVIGQCGLKSPGRDTQDIYVGSRKMEENIATLHLLINCKENIPNTEQLEALIDLDNVWEQLFSVDHDWPIPLAIAGKLTKTLQGIYHFRDMGTKGHQIEMEFPVKTIPSTVTSPERTEAAIRLLLVEDHAINQIAARRLLSKMSEKIQIDIAANGEAGLQMFREHPYDIILMDLYMPVMDGLEATRRIRAISKTPIIALTTEASPEEEEKCYAAGMDDYLTKPFQLPDIYPRILKLIRRNER